VATLVYVEEPGDLTQQTLAFARGLGEPLQAYTAGDPVDVRGVEKVHHAEGDAFGTFAPAAIARGLVELMNAHSPSAVVASGTPRANDVLARVAAVTDLPLAAGAPALGAGGRIVRLPVELPSVSSRLVRARLASGGLVDDLVPARVARYIQRRRLYRQEAAR